MMFVIELRISDDHSSFDVLQINEDRVPSVINWASKRDKIDSPDPWSPANWKNIQLNLSAQIFIISEKTQYFGLALYFVDEISPYSR